MRAWFALAVLLAITPGEAWAAGQSPELVRTGFLLTVLAFLPAIFISMTSFIRIAVVLAMVRHAFGMPETPPNAVLVSLAALLTAFVMGPTFSDVNELALKPLMAGEVSVEQAIERGSAPLRDFMLAQTRDEDIASIYAISGDPPPQDAASVDIIKLAWSGLSAASAPRPNGAHHARVLCRGCANSSTPRVWVKLKWRAR
jgi:flagellar biosynthesis protein FliP